MNSVESVQRPPATRRGGEAAEPIGAATASRRLPRELYWLPVATLIIGLLVTGALVLVSHSQYVSNEQRLLKLRVEDAGALLAESLPATESLMAAAVEQANSTNGNVQRFQALVTPQVGTKSGQWLSLSLWKVGALGNGPVAVAGVAPKLAATSATAARFLGTAAHSSTLSVIGLLKAPSLRIGYAFANPAEPGGYVVYGVLAAPRPAGDAGTDVGPSVEAGVPAFTLSQDGTRYFDIHHTPDDTLDKIDRAQLDQNVAAWAALVWLAADSDVDFRAHPGGAAH